MSHLREAVDRAWTRLCDFGAGLRLTDAEVRAFPNRIREPEPYRPLLSPVGRTIAWLMLAALLPRWIMAWRLPTLCTDALGYIAMAESFERSARDAQSIYGFSLYPPILAGLHQLGLSWDTAARVWGVACSTLVVPFLFGFVRRQFNNSVSIVACLLYAGHPDLIELSPEMIRDQTFWLLFAAGTYYTWRAVTEVRLRYFLLAGIVVPICLLARFEGAFLLIPLVGWSAARCVALRVGRYRPIIGLLLAASIAPAGLAAVNAFWLKRESTWQMVHREPLKRIQSLAESLLRPESAAAGVAATTSATVRPSPFSREVIWKSLRTCERGLTPIFGLLLLGSSLYYWRLFCRSDHLPTVLVALVTAGGVWVHYWYCGEASSRYLMSTVILGSRCAAVGLMRIIDVAANRLARRPAFALRPDFSAAAAAPVLLLAWTVIGWCDALSTGFESRIFKAELGRMIQDRYGSECHLVGADQQLAIVGYYAEARTDFVPFDLETEQIPNLLQAHSPDVLVLSPAALSPRAYAGWNDACRRQGYVEQPLPERSRPKGLVVLGRTPLQR